VENMVAEKEKNHKSRELTQLSPWSRVLERLVKKLPTFYGTRRFITAFTSARHLSLSWARSIQSIPPLPIYWRSILILSSHLRLGLQNGLSLRSPD